MKGSISIRRLIWVTVAALLLTVIIPSVTTLAQGRGHGKGHGNGNGNGKGDWSNRLDRDRSTSIWRNTTGRNRNYTRHYNKKCGKFVNCHDARDGRIDGRGPRGTRVDNVVRNLALVVADYPEVAAACTTALMSGNDEAVRAVRGGANRPHGQG